MHVGVHESTNLVNESLLLEEHWWALGSVRGPGSAGILEHLDQALLWPPTASAATEAVNERQKTRVKPVHEDRPGEGQREQMRSPVAGERRRRAYHPERDQVLW